MGHAPPSYYRDQAEHARRMARQMHQPEVAQTLLRRSGCNAAALPLELPPGQPRAADRRARVECFNSRRNRNALVTLLRAVNSGADRHEIEHPDTLHDEKLARPSTSPCT
jgi:hypothetical protein